MGGLTAHGARRICAAGRRRVEGEEASNAELFSSETNQDVAGMSSDVDSEASENVHVALRDRLVNLINERESVTGPEIDSILNDVAPEAERKDLDGEIEFSDIAEA